MRAAAAFVLCLAACGRNQPAPEGAAPSASVLSLGLSLATCPDPAACLADCDAGVASRCRTLAVTYAVGEGVDKDEARAAALYSQGCDLMDPSACVFAGQMNEFSHGVPKDDAKAARFYARACDAHWAPGCYNLAIMYERGTGVPRDRARAADLYDGPCRAGVAEACDKAKRMRTPDDASP